VIAASIDQTTRRRRGWWRWLVADDEHRDLIGRDVGRELREGATLRMAGNTRRRWERRTRIAQCIGDPSEDVLHMLRVRVVAPIHAYLVPSQEQQTACHEGGRIPLRRASRLTATAHATQGKMETKPNRTT
jgi:hypothetical protein